MTIDQIVKIYEKIPQPAQLVAIPEKDFRLSPRDGQLLRDYGFETDFRLQVTKPTLEALYHAKSGLEIGEELQINSAYRPAELLAVLWHKRLEAVKARFPALSDAQIAAFARDYTAAPDHPGFPPHSRGDAVDVGLVRVGFPVPLYEPPLTFEKMQFNYYENIICDDSEFDGSDWHVDRAYLRNVMTQAGFIPYEKEYWHFGLTPVFPEVQV